MHFAAYAVVVELRCHQRELVGSDAVSVVSRYKVLRIRNSRPSCAGVASACVHTICEIALMSEALDLSLISPIGISL